MNILSVIEKKKNAEELSPMEVEFFVNGVTDGSVSDAQTAAFLMAVVINGMTESETFALTDAMARSGVRISLDKVSGETVDKHSSGGVGDSTTFIVAPALTAMGYKCAKLSGRGLGHTGGTLDKLEAVKGLKVELSDNEFIKQVNDIGIAVIGQSRALCPADKRLYAIRDVTATVDSIPLIASSIMSKKLAGGAKNIVLDVKCGKGAFMKNEKRASALAKLMTEIGKNAGRNTVAVVTRMDEPLDNYIGNGLELLGALKVLRGAKNRLYNVSKSLVAALLEALGENSNKAKERFDEVIFNGSALRLFETMIERQGGDISMLDENGLMTAKHIVALKASRCGYISGMDCEGIGRFACFLGAGRTKLGDSVEHNVGIELNVKIGDYIKKDDIIAHVHYNRSELAAFAQGFESLIRYSEDKIKPLADVIEVIR